jgi:hypothetical protein
VPWSKFDPDAAPAEPEGSLDTSAKRRALVLKYAWWVTVVYTALGFGFIAYWLFR